MTTDDAELLEGGPEDPCGVCGHSESSHIARDYELAGRTVRQTYCEACEDQHDFVPAPQ